MYSISFIFKPGTYDDEFHGLDAATQAVAESTGSRDARRTPRRGLPRVGDLVVEGPGRCNAVYY